MAIGHLFFGESKYSARSGGSKVALAALAYRLHEWGWPLIDAQVENEHLMSLGALSCPRESFLRQVAELTSRPSLVGSWTDRFGVLPATVLADTGRH